MYDFRIDRSGQVNTDTPYPLRRVVKHDSRSLAYAEPERDLATMADVTLSTSLFAFNQGQYGSCTADAATKVLSYGDQVDAAVAAVFDGWTKTGDEEPYIKGFYNAEETHDGDGPFPPNDNGSSGLTAAWVAKQRGLISGYTHALSFNSAVGLLDKGAYITGTNWTSTMFNPTAAGELKATGSVEGGHEYVIFARDMTNQRVWMQNSWWTPDQPWGVKGPNGADCCAWMSFATYEKLLGEQGDATYFVPLSQPAPTPTPTPVPPAPTPAPSEQDLFVTQAKAWTARRHTAPMNTRFVADVNTYLEWLNNQPQGD